MQYVQHDPLSSQEQYTSLTAHAAAGPSGESNVDAPAETNNGTRLRGSMMQDRDPAVEAAAADLSSSLEQCMLDAPGSHTHIAVSHPPPGSIEGYLEGRAAPATSAKWRRTKVAFEDFSAQVRLERYHEGRLRILRHRQIALQRAIALCARLHRIGQLTHNGLVEISRRGDKAGFVQVYHTLRELKDHLFTSWKRHEPLSHSLTEHGSQSHDEAPEAVSCISRLPDGSIAELSELIHLLRSSPDFLVDRLKALSRPQLEALSACPEYSNFQTPGLPSASRARNHLSQHKRNVSFSNALKDCALSFERSDPLAFLLFNVYDSSPDPNSADYNLRLDVWSSVCAHLFIESEDDYEPLFNEVFKAFAALHEWRAKQRLELFLMDLLQRSAFLLKSTEDATHAPDVEHTFVDPLGTEAAEDFLDRAVHDLFEVLNDQDGGLPYGALHFGSSVLGKLDATRQSSFRGHFFFQWFFCEFLRKTMIHPENEGMLLQSHVSEQARNKILFPVWCRAWNKVQEVYLPSDSATSPSRSVDEHVKAHVEQMVSRLIDIQRVADHSESTGATDGPPTTSPPSLPDGPPVALVLAAAEIGRTLDALYPKPAPLSTPFDQFLNSSATAFAAQYSQTNKSSRDVFRERHSLSLADPDPVPSYATASRHHSFRAGKTGAVGYFERLRRDLFMCTESTAAPPLSYVCDEPWLQFTVTPQGPVCVAPAPPAPPPPPPPPPPENHRVGQSAHSSPPGAAPPPKPGYAASLDAVQRAALRLVDRHQGLVASPASNSSFGVGAFRGQSLAVLFDAEVEFARSRTDTTDVHYWWSALKALRKQYPLASLGHDDSQILRAVLQASQDAQADCERSCLALDNHFVPLKAMFDRLSDAISDLVGRLDKLRDKVWYTLDVMHSDVYERTKMIALALNNMVARHSGPAESGAATSRGRVPARSVTGSLLERPHLEVTGVMKAATHHGGPKKLADDQVDLTRRWLQSNAVENFCRGEERIHRFCMEIRLATKKLVGEAMNESPVLWASDLYQRERGLFDSATPKPFLASTTRPASIMSEDVPYLYQHSPHGHRGLDYGTRLHGLETQSSPGRKSSFHSSSSSRPTRDYYYNNNNNNNNNNTNTNTNTNTNDTSSMGGSPGRAVSATTTESISSVWSPPGTQAQSMTSISSHSRPASTYNDGTSSKTVDQAIHAKTQFLDRLRQSLVTLLLSDLGCPVWSCGSETDAWLELVLQHDRVQHRLEQRVGLERLLSSGPKAAPVKRPPVAYVQRPTKKRSTSASPALTTRAGPVVAAGDERSPDDAAALPRPGAAGRFSYADAYRQVTDKFGKESNPARKLDALYELKMLVMAHLREPDSSSSSSSSGSREAAGQRPPRASLPSSRRSSLNHTSFGPTNDRHDAAAARPAETMPNEDQIVHRLKAVLLETKPRTLFRDLQYISAFVPSEITNKTDSGQAFLHVGLAALAYKDDVCRSMVDVAAKIIATDSVKRRAASPGTLDSPLVDAAFFLTLAAKEGNAVAQRELASLYLAHPGLLQPHSLPLTLPRETFRSDMVYWRPETLHAPHTEAMCLALHWMQHAATNGDEIARRNLMEREGSYSIR